MANGIRDIVANNPFPVVICNLGSSPARLRKGQIVGLALASPCAICALHAQDSENRLDTETTGASKEKPDWKDEVHIGAKDSGMRTAVIELLRDFQEMWDGQLGTIKATKHRIELTPGAKPVYQQPYRAGHREREKEKKQIDHMLRDGVIEPSDAEWASPVVLIPKPDGSLRFCIDYRKLNAITKRDSYPLPRMDECIDSLGEASVFTTLDCNSGYWQVPVDEADCDKTTFRSHYGLYRFLRMLFGLCNAPATFQRAVDIILSRCKWQFSLVYLDDVIVYSRSFDHHLGHLRTVLSLLRNAVSL